MLIFGCEPGNRVNADSCLIPSFLQRVRASKLGNNAVVLPGRLLNFRTKNGGESVCSYELDLHFFGPKPQMLQIEVESHSSSTKDDAEDEEEEEESKAASNHEVA